MYDWNGVRGKVELLCKFLKGRREEGSKSMK